MALVAAGLTHALTWGAALRSASRSHQRMAGAFSATIWIGTLACGRVLGYL